jgi:hypothetical protein
MGNWYCNNCRTYKGSWAEHQSYKPEETYRRDTRCWSCNNWSLIYTDSQKERYKRLVKERTSISGSVEEVERFSTWWSNNVATAVVYYDGCYRVFLLAYDPAYSTHRPAVFPESSDCGYWGEKSRGRHSYLSDAKNEASWLRNELNGSYGKYSDNPILLIHPGCDCYRSFGSLVTEPYVTNRYSTSYLKPFDVVKTNMDLFQHVGVYLGKIDGESKVCHFTRKKKDTTIDSWSSFLEGEVVAYHPIIPFKNYKDIARQIVWAKDNSFRKNNYDLHRRNCEHFANMIVYGINFSEQIERSKGKLTGGAVATAVTGAGYFTGMGLWTTISSIALAPVTGGASLLIAGASAVATGAGIGATVKLCESIDDSGANDGKTSVNLRDEIRNTDNLLGKKSDWETEKYETKYLQEVPAKENCRIM